MCEKTMLYDFESFLNYVRDNVKDYIEESEYCHVQIIPMLKNNQVIMEGLQISNASDNHAPIIYLEGFYENFCAGKDMEEILTSIAHVYEESKNMKGYIDPEKVTDFLEMKERLILRLINGEKNKDVLQRCPHRFVEDLAITYRVLAGKNESGISTFLISNELMEEWKVDEQCLYEIACENSLCLFPPIVEKISDMLRDCYGFNLSRIFNDYNWQEETELYILTNDIKINGASAACYSDALEWFSKKIGKDFYVLPSSIHEMLLLPVNDAFSPDYLQSVIRDANKRVVLEEEVLSDNLYFYSLKERKMRKYEAM